VLRKLAHTPKPYTSDNQQTVVPSLFERGRLTEEMHGIPNGVDCTANGCGEAPILGPISVCLSAALFATLNCIVSATDIPRPSWCSCGRFARTKPIEQTA
jgi:hypothetical protein